tara:strand:- start:39276 stop:39827 length:552 start_codon:yes stop_codon:yes gene_type:complete
MNYLTSNPTGIDAVLQSFQKDLYSSLLRFIALQNGQSVIDGFGRIYKNSQREGGYIPEWWNEKTNSYEEMYLDSSKKVTFYFIVGEQNDSEDGSFFTTDLKVVFLVDLSWIKTPNRADAEAQKIFTTCIQKDTDESFEMTGIELGLENVFSGFDISKTKFDNMQPYHAVSINGKIGYYLNQNC